MRKGIIFLVLGVVIGLILMWVYIRIISQWLGPQSFYIRTDDAQLINMRQDLEALKANLRKQGIYDCCIKNDCNWCAIYMGHCSCAKLISIKGNEKSCPECAAAWSRKQGKIPGVDPDAIQVTTFGIYGFEEGGHYHETHQNEKHHEERVESETTGHHHQDSHH